MELMKINGGKAVHKVIDLPPLETPLVIATGRKGPACGRAPMLYMSKFFEGKRRQITCKRCLKK